MILNGYVKTIPWVDAPESKAGYSAFDQGHKATAAEAEHSCDTVTSLSIILPQSPRVRQGGMAGPFLTTWVPGLQAVAYAALFLVAAVAFAARKFNRPTPSAPFSSAEGFPNNVPIIIAMFCGLSYDSGLYDRT